MLLGEKLIAFRDSSGRVGVMDHRCPHRCASLFLGRNEENGMRCVYHGWKFDTDGNCVDMPNVAGAPDFKHLIKAKAYKAAERNGLVWVYMGERARGAAAAADRGDAAARSRGARSSSCSANATGCRRSKATSTPRISAFCMPARSSPTMSPDDSLFRYTVTNRAPDYHVADTDCGTMYAAYRDGGARPDLLALRQFHAAVLDPDAAGQVHRASAQPRLGPDGRHPHDVRQPDAGGSIRRRSARTSRTRD